MGMAAKPRILIVEDDEALGELYEERLRKEGYQVFWAKTGEEGSNMAMEEKPDLILLDILLPERGGLGVLQTIKTWTETKQIPIIIMTAMPGEEHKEEALRLGAAAYFVKSQTTPQQIVEAIKQQIKPAK